MLDRIRIQNFRVLKNLEINGFRNINIFIGEPNTGKTSILEALYIYFGDLKKDNSILEILESRRMIIDDDCFKSLFYDYMAGKENKIVFNGKYNGDDEYTSLDIYNDNTLSTNFDLTHDNIISKGIDTLKCEYKKGKNITDEIHISKSFFNPQQIQFQTQITKNTTPRANVASFICNGNFEHVREHLKNILEDRNKKNDFIQRYKKFSEDIEEISFLGEKIAVQIQGLNKSINFKLMGQGFQRYVYIQSAICDNKKYIMIDEIENGLHFESIDMLVNTMLEAHDIQFFITTHNKELLQKIAKIFTKKQVDDRLAVFKVYKNQERNIEIGRYSQEDFIFHIEKKNEIRD